MSESFSPLSPPLFPIEFFSACCVRFLHSYLSLSNALFFHIQQLPLLRHLVLPLSTKFLHLHAHHITRKLCADRSFAYLHILQSCTRKQPTITALSDRFDCISLSVMGLLPRIFCTLLLLFICGLPASHFNASFFHPSFSFTDLLDKYFHDPVQLHLPPSLIPLTFPPRYINSTSLETFHLNDPRSSCWGSEPIWLSHLFSVFPPLPFLLLLEYENKLE